MGDSESRLDCKSAQYLFGSTAVKGVKAAAQDLAIDRENPTLAQRRRAGGAQICSMGSESGLDIGDIETAENGSDRGMGGGLLPTQAERGVEALQMHADKSVNAPIGVGTGDDRKDRE